MKRTILTGKQAGLAAMLLLTLAACSGDDEGALRPAAATAIAFAPETAATRGTALTEIPEGKAFAVSGYAGTEGSSYATPYLYNVPVMRTGSDYAYAPPLYYWPSSPDVKIRFYAWYPSGLTVSDRATVPPQIDYTVPTDVASQQDLLYACTDPMNNAFDYTADPPAPQDAADKVSLTFSHALSQLSFKVQMADDVPTDYTASIRSLSVYAIGSGTMTLPAGSGDAAWTVERDFSEGASMSSLGIFVLTPGQGLPAANGSITDGNETVVTYNIAVQERSSGGLPAVAAPHGTPLLLTAADGYLFMVPQQPPVISLAKPTQLRTPVLNIRYRLDNGLQLQDKSGKTADDFGNPYTADRPSPDWLYTDKDVSLSLTDVHLTLQGKTKDDIKGEATDPWVWETGKSYCYVITISTADVTLNILPTDWIDGNNGETEYKFE